MEVLQRAIDRMGKPPREVCLDWAWQIREFDYQPDKPLTFRHIGLQEHGRLSLLDVSEETINEGGIPNEAAPHNVQVQKGDHSGSSSEELSTAGSLIAQLMEWAGEPNWEELIKLDEESSNSFERHLFSATQSVIAERHAATDKAGSTLNKTPNFNKNANATKPKPSRTGTRPRQQRKREKRSRAAVGVVIGVTAVLLIAIAGFWMFREDKTVVAANETNVEPSGAPGEVEGSEVSEENGDPEISTEIPDTLLTVDSAFSAQEREIPSVDSPANLLAKPQISSISSDSDAVEKAAEGHTAEIGHSAETESDLSKPMYLPGSEVEQLADSVGKAEIESMEATQSMDGEGRPIDALQELKAASKAATEKSAEVELQTASSESKKPLTLAAFPVQQTQDLPTRLGVRLRQAKWTIRLEPPEGFTVVPATAQVVAGRELVTWSLAAKDEPKFSTRIMVQAQLVSPRSAKLRWRILAISSNLPQLTLPVEGKLLSNLQTMAATLNQRLQGGIDQLGAMAKTPGIQSSAKSELYRRRDNYRSQLEKMELVKDVISEANQLEGWSDGQFTLHARLDDANAPAANAPAANAIVEFGEVELTEEEMEEELGKEQADEN